jgi:hypothetical protein
MSRHTKAAEPSAPANTEIDEDYDPTTEVLATEATPATGDGGSSPEMRAMAAVVERMGTAIEKLTANAPTKKIQFHELAPKTAFNPQGKRTRRLDRRVYQNGVRLQEHILTDGELALLPNVRAGKYIGGLVTIRLVDTPDGEDLYIDYANKAVEQRMALKGEFKSFEVLLQRCITEGPTVPARDQREYAGI